MLFKFIVKYFFLNKKRTYKAIFILALNSIIIFSTAAMIFGFNSEIQLLTTLNSQERFTVLIRPNNGENELSMSEITKIENFITGEPSVRYFRSVYSEIMTFNHKGVKVITELQITNITTLERIGWFNLKSNNFTHGVFLSSFSNFADLKIGSTIHISTSFLDFQVPLQEVYTPKQDIPDIAFLDLNYSKLPLSFADKAHFVEIEFFDEAGIELIDKILQNNSRLEVVNTQSGDIFLSKSFSDIMRYLQLIQIIVGVLQFFAVAYINHILIKESKKDIRNLKNIGYGDYFISSIFIGQSALIGIISTLIAYIISIILVNLFLSFLIIFLNFSFIFVNVPLYQFFFSFIQNLLISILATLFTLPEVLK